MELKRTIEQWRGGDPEAMAYHMSEAAIMFAFKDAKSDILALHAEVERLRAAIEQTLDENGHLADGENCTLIVLKRALKTPNVELTGRSAPDGDKTNAAGSRSG